MGLAKLGMGKQEQVGTSETETEAPSAETPEVETPQDTPEGKAEVSGKEPDYKALYEEEQAKTKKMESDSKAQKGLTMSRKEQDDLLRDVAGRVGGLETGFNIWLDREASQDQGLADQVSKAKAKTTARERVQAFADVAATTMQQINEALVAADGTVLLDLETAPELKHVREAWNAEVDSENPNPEKIARLRGEVERQARVTERALATERIATAETKAAETNAETEKAKADRAALAERTGVMDNEPGTISGGGDSDEAFLKKMGDTSYFATPADHLRNKKILESRGIRI